MATELPHAERIPLEEDRDPTYSGSHPLLRPESRGARPSSRPSAFGPPRIGGSIPPPMALDDASVLPEGPPQTSELRLKRDPSVREPSPSAARRSLPPHGRHSITTDIEQLLPISHGVKSLPRPPRMPSAETFAEPTARRLPWASVAVFSCALVASVGSLLHYTALDHAPGVGLDPSSGASQAAGSVAGSDATWLASNEPNAAASHPDARVRAALRAHIGAAWSPAGRTHDPLLAEARHALATGDHQLAEPLFAALHAVHPTAAALGLAEVRRAQGDALGAEGWALTALHQRLHDPRAHQLYAELLEDDGRPDEALLERAVARSLSARTR